MSDTGPNKAPLEFVEYWISCVKELHRRKASPLATGSWFVAQAVGVLCDLSRDDFTELAGNVWDTMQDMKRQVARQAGHDLDIVRLAGGASHG